MLKRRRVSTGTYYLSTLGEIVSERKFAVTHEGRGKDYGVSCLIFA